MRNNQPVTDKEHLLPENALIVSKTDLKGIITYVNRDFVEASGYKESELIGAPHNILRHPDMPAAAFKDLWDTLEAGKPWSALVKNRRKNGDYYWVIANATPIWEGGRIVGYMSVRTSAARDAIPAAEQLYRNIRENRAKGIAVREGQVVKTGFSLGKLLSGLQLRQMFAGMAILVAVVIVLGTAVNLLNSRNKILEEKQIAVRHEVETALSLVSRYGDLAKSGAMPEQEAKQQAAQALKILRYGGTDYFWINDMTPRMVMHPTKPELDGKDLGGIKDPNGKALFREFVAVVAKSGGGFVDYEWPKPGASEPQPKISYVQGYAP